MTQEFSVPNRFVGRIACSEAQYNKAVSLAERFGQTFDEMHFNTSASGEHFPMVVSMFGSMTIGILPDGSSHS